MFEKTSKVAHTTEKKYTLECDIRKSHTRSSKPQQMRHIMCFDVKFNANFRLDLLWIVYGYDTNRDYS